MLTRSLCGLSAVCALQYPDVNHGTVKGKPIREVLADSAEWLDGEFITVVQQRGAAIIKVRRCDTSSATPSCFCCGRLWPSLVSCCFSA